jgi:hypothetical protein
LQFDKAFSAQALSQQKKFNSEDIQRYGFIPRGNVPGRCRRMFEPQLRSLRLRQKTWRGPPAVLPEAHVWQHAGSDGANFSFAARHAANRN